MMPEFNIDGENAETRSNCLAVESLVVPLQDMNLDITGVKATLSSPRNVERRMATDSEECAGEIARKSTNTKDPQL